MLAVAVALAAAVFFAAHTAVVSQGLVLNPQVTGFSSPANNAATQIIGQNPARKLLQICNPTASVIVWIAPTGVTVSANGAGSIGLPAVSSGTTSCFTIPTVPGGIAAGNSWSAIGASTPYTLTIFEYN
jgi:hypothetical protein